MAVREMMVNRRVALIVLVVLGLLSRYRVADASVPNMIRHYTPSLHAKGYGTATAEHLICASESDSYFIRYCALYLLTDRVGKEAVPVLVGALDDEKATVRRYAAHLLGTLGSKAGLNRMRQDLKTLAPANGVPPVYDPNLPDSAKEKAEKRRRFRLGLGLEVVKVLAESGDYSGYELAKRMGLEGPPRTYRSRAIYALTELARIENTIPPEEEFHPTLVLCAMARSETDSYAFGRITSAGLSLGGARGIGILTAAQKNPHQGQEELRRAASYMKSIERSLRRNCRR